MVTVVEGTNHRPFEVPWLNVDLPAMLIDRSPAHLEILAPRHVRLIPGMEQEVKWKFVPQQPGVEVPEDIQIEGLPFPRNIFNVWVSRENESTKGVDNGVITVLTNEKTMPVKFDLMLGATVIVDGREETVTSRAITFEIVPCYEIDIQDKITLRPGRTTEVAGTICREPAFTSPVAIKVQYLPPNVAFSAAEVAGDSKEFRLLCQASSSARPGTYEIELRHTSQLATGPNKHKALNPHCQFDV